MKKKTKNFKKQREFINQWLKAGTYAGGFCENCGGRLILFFKYDAVCCPGCNQWIDRRAAIRNALIAAAVHRRRPMRWKRSAADRILRRQRARRRIVSGSMSAAREANTGNRSVRRRFAIGRVNRLSVYNLILHGAVSSFEPLPQQAVRPYRG